MLHGFYLNRIAGGARDHVAVYVWREFRSQRAFTANFEIAECGWFDVDALPPDVGKGTARRVREIFDGTAPACGMVIRVRPSGQLSHNCLGSVARTPQLRGRLVVSARLPRGLELPCDIHDFSFTRWPLGANARFRRQEASRMENVVHVTRRP